MFNFDFSESIVDFSNFEFSQLGDAMSEWEKSMEQLEEIG